MKKGNGKYSNNKYNFVSYANRNELKSYARFLGIENTIHFWNTTETIRKKVKRCLDSKNIV